MRDEWQENWSWWTSALRHDVEPEEWQDRRLNDGSHWLIYKRCFTPGQLIYELGGGETIFAGRWFVVVRAQLSFSAERVRAG
jgi:hypothetical protein